MNIEYIRQALTECDGFLSASAEADLNVTPVESMRKTRSAVFCLKQAIEELVKDAE